MILNEELLDPKEREIVMLNLKIARLEKTIRDFKEYDANRKKYYSELITEVESYIEKLENGTALTKLRKKCKEQKKQLIVLNNSKMHLQDKVKDLINQVKSQKKTISELVSKLNVQQRKEKLKTQIMEEITKSIHS